MKSQRGLTLIELLAAVAVVAILSGFAVSALGGWLEAARASAARADLLASLAQAAARSGLTGTRAVLCPSVDASQCSDEPDWSLGWLVFMDNNASRELEGGERILRVQPPLPGKVRLRTTAGRTRIVFQASAVTPGSNATFTLCDGRGPSRARTLVLANDAHLRDGVPTTEAIAATCQP